MTLKQIIEDMTKEEKEVYDFLVSAKTKDYPNLKDMIDNFWQSYFYMRKSPPNEFGYLE